MIHRTNWFNQITQKKNGIEKDYMLQNLLATNPKTIDEEKSPIFKE